LFPSKSFYNYHLIAKIDEKYVSKLEDTLKNDNRRMRVAEGKAEALTWDISQAKEAKKVRVKVRV
jgi:hypothetical protein